MKRILLLCRHDWRSPAAGDRERYAFEIFSRVAGAGHYVVWICCNVPLLPPFRKRLPTVERIAGMLVAHLGSPLMYRFMAPLFFRRFTRSFAKVGGFDVCVDCVQGTPSPLVSEIQAPLLPLVFHLDSALRATSDMPGPVIAATMRAEKELRDAGTPEKFLVRVPHGVDAATFRTGGERSGEMSVVAECRSPRLLMKALRILESRGCTPSLTVPGAASPAERASLYQNAWVGYCGKGHEEAALAMGACGLVCACPDTAKAREFVEPGVTGLIHELGSAASLADALFSLLTDCLRRDALSERALEHGRTRSWDVLTARVLDVVASF
jgi:hypothetical protein